MAMGWGQGCTLRAPALPCGNRCQDTGREVRPVRTRRGPANLQGRPPLSQVAGPWWTCPLGDEPGYSAGISQQRAEVQPGVALC